MFRKIPNCILLWALLLVIRGNAQAADRTVYTLKISDDTTLKDIYDSGIRPWRDANVLDKCYIGPCRIRLEFGNSKAIEIPIESGSFRILKEGLISVADFSTGLLEVEDASEIVQQINASANLSMPIGSSGVVASKANSLDVKTQELRFGIVNV
jgi:hypothetical protein